MHITSILTYPSMRMGKRTITTEPDHRQCTDIPIMCMKMNMDTKKAVFHMLPE